MEPKRTRSLKRMHRSTTIDEHGGTTTTEVTTEVKY